MKRAFYCALISILLVCGGPTRTAWADGGTIQGIERHGDLQIAVFTAPNPLRAGVIDVSIMAQDAHTGQPLSELPATVTLEPRDQPGAATRAALVRANATNQLMQSALVEVPAAGEWRLRLDVKLPERLVTSELEIAVGPALPRWLGEWPWFAWPGLAVGMFAVHRLRVARLRGAGAIRSS